MNVAGRHRHPSWFTTVDISDSWKTARMFLLSLLLCIILVFSHYLSKFRYFLCPKQNNKTGIWALFPIFYVGMCLNIRNRASKGFSCMPCMRFGMKANWTQELLRALCFEFCVFWVLYVVHIFNTFLGESCRFQIGSILSSDFDIYIYRICIHPRGITLIFCLDSTFEFCKEFCTEKVHIKLIDGWI